MQDFTCYLPVMFLGIANKLLRRLFDALNFIKEVFNPDLSATLKIAATKLSAATSAICMGSLKALKLLKFVIVSIYVTYLLYVSCCDYGV